jgi:hypothetical protein
MSVIEKPFVETPADDTALVAALSELALEAVDLNRLALDVNAIKLDVNPAFAVASTVEIAPVSATTLLFVAIKSSTLDPPTLLKYMLMNSISIGAT